MAYDVLHLDSFNAWTTDKAAYRYINGPWFFENGFGAGRYDGGMTLRIVNAAFSVAYLKKDVGPRESILTGFDFKMLGLPWDHNSFFRFSNSDDAAKITLAYTTLGKLEIWLEDVGEDHFTGTLLHTTPDPVFAPNEWRNLVVKISVPQGLQIWSEGDLIVNLPMLTTWTTGAENLAILGPRYQIFGGSGYQMDNYWVMDGASTLITSPLRVDSMYPRIDDASAWIRSAGADVNAFKRIYEHFGVGYPSFSGSWPDDDTSYLYSETLGDDALVYVDPAPITGAVLAYQFALTAKAIDAPASFRSYARVPNTVLSDPLSVDTSSYLTHTVIYPTNPLTGLSWDDNDVNAGRFGVRLVSGKVRLTQLVLERLALTTGGAAPWLAWIGLRGHN